MCEVYINFTSKNCQRTFDLVFSRIYIRCNTPTNTTTTATTTAVEATVPKPLLLLADELLRGQVEASMPPVDYTRFQVRVHLPLMSLMVTLVARLQLPYLLLMSSIVVELRLFPFPFHPLSYRYSSPVKRLLQP